MSGSVWVFWKISDDGLVLAGEPSLPTLLVADRSQIETESPRFF